MKIYKTIEDLKSLIKLEILFRENSESIDET